MEDADGTKNENRTIRQMHHDLTIELETIRNTVVDVPDISIGLKMVRESGRRQQLLATMIALCFDLLGQKRGNNEIRKKNDN